MDEFFFYNVFNGVRTKLLALAGRPPAPPLDLEAVRRIHERVLNDLGGPATPVDPSFDPDERERMKKRLWGPLASDRSRRVLIRPRWDEYSLESRLKFLEPFRRYTRALIDTFWAGCPEPERRAVEEDVLEIYQDPSEVLRAMPFSFGFLIHQTVHLITNDEEFTARLVYQLASVPAIEGFAGKKVPAAWKDPVARETFPWLIDLLERPEEDQGLLKHLRGNRIVSWLGSAMLELHRGGFPLAGRFADVYLFLRSRLPPTSAHLRWIDEAANAAATLRAPGDARPLERGEAEKAWASAPAPYAALKPGLVELTLRGGFATEHFFAPR